MTATLAAGLKTASVDFETLHQKYNPVLALVRELIGVVPNCDPILEIWPPGFRTYNLLVPNLFNLPNTLFGNSSFKASMGLAMYAASKTSSCAYCTAHACSFALRRGASAAAIQGERTPKEAAVVALAEGLARIPANLTGAEVQAVHQYFTPVQVAWLVSAISMMGFLNKFMNAVGVELEQDAINDTAAVLSPTGWHPGLHAPGNFRITKAVRPPQDNLGTYLRVIRQAPGAISLEKSWTRGVPDTYEAAGAYLLQKTGYAFPILKLVPQKRVVRALATALRENLSKETTVVGLKVKMMAGYLFCRIVSNNALSTEVKNMAAHFAPGGRAYEAALEEIALADLPSTNAACREAVASFGQQLGLSQKEAAALLLARAAAPSPSPIHEAVIETALRDVRPAGVVEMIVWLSVLQLLHRLSSYHTVAKVV